MIRVRHNDRDRWGRPPQGAAMLIVLATLVLTVTATTILVNAAASIQARNAVDRATVMCDDLLLAAEAPIQHWLTSKSAKVVLSPESPSPQVSVLHDRLQSDSVEFELVITAWDQYGMVPVELVQSGSSLRSELPIRVIQVIEAILAPAGIVPPGPPGLDLYIDSDHGTIANPFPKAAEVLPVLFGNGPITTFELPTKSELALGEMVATHNNKPYRINVNTVPISVVEAVLSAVERGGLDQIIAMRSQGKPASVSGQFALPIKGSTSGDTSIQLVSSSNRWSFRIDARFGPVRKSWWAIYLPAASRQRSPQSPAWECVQRLVISH